MSFWRIFLNLWQKVSVGTVGTSPWPRGFLGRLLLGRIQREAPESFGSVGRLLGRLLLGRIQKGAPKSLGSVGKLLGRLLLGSIQKGALESLRSVAVILVNEVLGISSFLVTNISTVFNKEDLIVQFKKQQKGHELYLAFSFPQLIELMKPLPLPLNSPSNLVHPTPSFPLHP